MENGHACVRSNNEGFGEEERTWIVSHHEGPLHIQDSKHMGPGWSTQLSPILPLCHKSIHSIPFTLTFTYTPWMRWGGILGIYCAWMCQMGHSADPLCSWDPYEKYVCVYNGSAHLQPVIGGRASDTHLLSLAAAPNEMFAADTSPFPPKQGCIVDFWYEEANCVGFYLVLCKLMFQMHLMFTHLLSNLL